MPDHANTSNTPALDLDDIETRTASLYEYGQMGSQDGQNALDQLTDTDVPALTAETRRLRAALEEIRHLHKDSPMGPCPVCIDADAVAAGGDGLVPYPCPTGRLAGAQDCNPPTRPAVSAVSGAADSRQA